MNNNDEKIAACPDLMARAEAYHQMALQRLTAKRRAELGQFMTPIPLARYMASLFSVPLDGEVRLLDAGAGVGCLSAAFVESLYRGEQSSDSLRVTAYELDGVLCETLQALMDDAASNCATLDLPFQAEVLERDFVFDAGERLAGDFFSEGLQHEGFTHAILNPPYKKISSRSDYRQLLNRLGLESNNLYSAFLSLAIRLLAPGGELVALVPRSFCNGPYFLSFRKLLLEQMSLRQLHLFESRDQAFAEDDVLQENIILHAVKDLSRRPVLLSSSSGPELDDLSLRLLPHAQVVRADSEQSFIHVASSELDSHVMERMARIEHSLQELGLDVSTGPVVEFRLKEQLQSDPYADGCVPMIYPAHFSQGAVVWPLAESRKAQSIAQDAFSDKVLRPNEHYTLVRRFSTKEERRRVMAVVYDPEQFDHQQVGFENHINIIYAKRQEMNLKLAKGLMLYLNSTLVDMYFRQFNGHTQVNATDLRLLPFPSRARLQVLGQKLGDAFPQQQQIDAWLEEDLLTQGALVSGDPTQARRRLDEARDCLHHLGINSWSQEVAALSLLSLASLEPERPWNEAQLSWLTVPQVMAFCRDVYGRAYVPWQQKSEHWLGLQRLLSAELLEYRQAASGERCYRLQDNIFQLLKGYGQAQWLQTVEHYQEALVGVGIE
ncbi:MAG: Eco57I restriction-modification methylase domain-containing protein [Gammaproteobacteria bacterium]|nr:Eco57I restriction-modification methylase domain-containing protein [Gammaproteobacteria bacterium]